LIRFEGTGKRIQLWSGVGLSLVFILSGFRGRIARDKEGVLRLLWLLFKSFLDKALTSRFGKRKSVDDCWKVPAIPLVLHKIEGVGRFLDLGGIWKPPTRDGG
jgi:hypothetical protein